MIVTERLILRPFAEEDKALIHQLYSSETIMRWMPFDVMDEDAAEKHLERIIREMQEEPVMNHELAVIKKEDREKIGRCHIQIDKETDTGMIGWLLLEKEWNHGYAQEITEALLEYCFCTLGLHRVNALCNPDNLRSRRVLEKCGFRLEAHYRKKVRYTRGDVSYWEDELEYALLETEYRQR